MKKLILTLAILLIPTLCFAATNVTLKWDANTETDLAGYRIYRSLTSGAGYSQVGEVAAPITEFVDQNIQDGTYFWVATAFDTSGNESGYSNEVTDILDSIAPAPPQNLNIWQKIIAWLRWLFGGNLRIS